MAQKNSDQTPASAGCPAAELNLAARTVLAKTAQHLRYVNPVEALAATTRVDVVGAMAQHLYGQLPGFPVNAVVRVALERAPMAREGLTRGEYALILRLAVWGSWGEDDNEPVIPRHPIPGQRESDENGNLPGQRPAAGSVTR